jgi:Right handed beta helix region
LQPAVRAFENPSPNASPNNNQGTTAMNMHTAKKLLIAGSLLALLAFAFPARSAVFDVSTVAELEAAIASANASPGLDTINLEPGLYLLTGTLQIADDIVINGAPSDSVVIRGAGNGLNVFQVFDASATFRTLTIRGAGGVGILYRSSGGLLELDSLAITGANIGLWVETGAATIRNTTLSGNDTGIEYEANDPLVLLNDTIVFNSFDGFGNFGGHSTVRNTIIAGNRFDCSSPPTASENNIDRDGRCGAGFVTADPAIGALRNNGGPTQTHALLSGSPAIDAGFACEATDQRGVARPQGPACDIGAYELIPLQVTFAPSAGTLRDLIVVPEIFLPTAGKPAGVTFPFHLYSWTVTGLAIGQTITVTMAFPSPVASSARYWKVIDDVWTDVTPLLGSDDGDNVLTLTITDGGPGDADGLQNGEITDPGGIAIPIGPAVVPFAAFAASLEIDRRDFELNATFTLGAASNGIAPATEAVHLEIGGFAATLPAGSLKSHGNGRFKFKGKVSGVKLDVTIRALGNGRFKLEADGKGVDLTGAVNPVPVTVTVGDDRGTASVPARVESRDRRGPRHREHEGED